MCCLTYKMSTFTIKSSLVFNKIQKAWDQAQGNMVHASTTPQHQGEINTPQSPNMIRIPLSHDYNHPHPIAITWGGGDCYAKCGTYVYASTSRVSYSATEC